VGTVPHLRRREIYDVNVNGVNMTKMVQLSNDAYELLKRAKKPDESFSDVVKRLAHKPKPLDLSGLRTKKEIEGARQMLKELHDLDLKDAEEFGRRHGLLK
jgi:predicted CopG family antitoxin